MTAFGRCPGHSSKGWEALLMKWMLATFVTAASACSDAGPADIIASLVAPGDSARAVV